MTTTLVVLAHPERRSFNGAWAQASAEAAAAQGDTVLWSDLYGMGFDPAERAAHYARGGAFDPLKAQEEAAAAGGLPGDVAGEVAKLQAADRIVLHFPLWWFAPPAMLKGWCERALVHGLLHDVDRRFDAGLMRGRSVLFCVSTGADETEAGPSGREGDTRLLLWPLAMTFRYLGYDVLDPVCAHGVHGYHSGAAEAALRERLGAVLEAQGDVLAGWQARARLPFNADAEFDAEGRLRTGSPQHTPFITPPA